MTGETTVVGGGTAVRPPIHRTYRTSACVTLTCRWWNDNPQRESANNLYRYREAERRDLHGGVATAREIQSGERGNFQPPRRCCTGSALIAVQGIILRLQTSVLRPILRDSNR
ncbi:hypothetical protein [Pseudomonas phage PIP]|nr:hypothetical protein [Pseudomonas phage PIP]